MPDEGVEKIISSKKFILVGLLIGLGLGIGVGYALGTLGNDPVDLPAAPAPPPATPCSTCEEKRLIEADRAAARELGQKLRDEDVTAGD